MIVTGCLGNWVTDITMAGCEVSCGEFALLLSYGKKNSLLDHTTLPRILEGWL
jgi:hypothetical protein